MMWKQIFLCCLVGFAAASDYGWKSNTEYVYKVHGRTLTGLHEVEEQYSGIFMKAKFVVQPQGGDKLYARIQDAKYAQVHAQFSEGWRSDVPEGKLNWNRLPITEETFEIVVSKGVVQDVFVSKRIPNWEANFIKAFVSNIQLDVHGQHVIKSHLNQLPEGNADNGVFKTMEDSISGKFETVYDISPLPEYVLHSQPWLAPKPELRGDGHFIEIVKNRNFNRSENVGYHYGFGSNIDMEPYDNKMGDFFLRSSMSRVVLSGKLQRYTIQSACTTNKIILSPTLNSYEKGMVVSHLNMTLEQVQTVANKFPEVQQRHALGSLTYGYNTPYSTENEPRQLNQMNFEEEDISGSSEETQYRPHYRYIRSVAQHGDSNDYWNQPRPSMHEAPEYPFLPYSIGYKGKSIKQASNINVEQVAQKLAQQIGEEIQRPDEIKKEKTLAKFTILARIVRIMNEKEIKQVAQQLYTQENSGAKCQAWRVYRDAVVESGTGPALMCIYEFIQNKKIHGEEAAEIIASTAQAAREPTPEYIRTFYKLATCEEVKRQPILNDSAILSFANLVRKVFVDEFYSRNQYPTQAFGSFYECEEGQKFVTEEFIPYLEQQLNQAVAKADSHQVLVYIRALGNVAHKNVFGVFEQYLEGQKQCSQFQRLSMVLAMDKLVQIYEKTSRSVLYKIYQNAADSQDVRCAAVFQIMRTSPPADMLQRMAQYTNVDTAEQVNAAVKSSIESIAELEDEQFAETAAYARSALPLLTTNVYGVQYSQNTLRSYVVREMNMLYKEHFNIIGSHDSIFPKGLKYYLRSELGGVRDEYFHGKFIVSSVDELINVLHQQTEIYHQRQQQQKQNAQQAQQNKFSSESILRLLNVQNEEREQLEGKLMMQFGGGVTRFFSFNNRTIEMLPQAIQWVEDQLRDGEDFDYTKYFNRYGITFSFPTATSFPFLYTLDAPTMLRIKANVQATAEPKISSGDKIHKPQTIKGKSQIHAVFSTKVQAKLGFITPFDHQHYLSGVEKNFQVQVPIKTQFEFDIKNKQARIEFEQLHDKNAQVFHYSMYPYTGQHDILKCDPLMDSNVHVIYAQEGPEIQIDHVFGQKTGLAFRVQYESERNFLNNPQIFGQGDEDFITAFFAPFNDENIHYTNANIEYDAAKSNVRKVIYRFGYEKRYETEESNDSTAAVPELEQFSELPHESKARQQKFAKWASAGINNAEVCVYDASVEFEGQNHVEYTATAAIAHGPVDQKARVLCYIKRHADSIPFEFAAILKSRIPQTNALDYGYAMKFDPTVTSQLDIAFGEDLKTCPKVHLQAKLERTEERKKYLQAHPRSHECRREMQEGNKHMPACAYMNTEAGLLDRVHVQGQFEHFNPQMRNASYKVYSYLRHLGYDNLKENFLPQGVQKDNEFEFYADFAPDFETVNVGIHTPQLHAHFDELEVDDYTKQLFVIHPSYPVQSRVFGEAMELDSYRPFCVVDQSAANTLDNKSYPLNLGKDWTVMMHYIPSFARQHQQHQKYYTQQEEQQHEQYVVLVRETKESDKYVEAKMTIRTPETQGQLIEIDLKPTKQQEVCAQVTVNQKQYELNDKKSVDIEGGYIRMYAIPNGEVVIEIRNAFYIVYDGERVRLSATSDKFRDSVRGLCGTFTGEEVDDFLTPKNCIVRDPEHFAAAYAIEGERRQQYQQQQQQYKDECYYEDIHYVNVVSDHDAGRTHQMYGRQNGVSKGQSYGGSCTKHQTRYVEQGDDICFTINPVPVCKHSCNGENYKQKSVPAHCIPRANAQMWMNQIQKGANPDFSHKAVSKSVNIDLPATCVKY